MGIIRPSLAITFVFALLWAALWFLRKQRGVPFSTRRASRGLLESRGKLILSAQHAVHVIRIGERDLALAVHPSGVELLCELPRSSTAQIVPVGEQ